MTLGHIFKAAVVNYGQPLLSTPLRRSDRADVGGRVSVGRRRRYHRQAERQPGPYRLARRRFAFTHHRGPRSAWNRGSVSFAGAGGRTRLEQDGGWGSSETLQHSLENQVASFSHITLNISDFPTRHNYGLGLWQNHMERILAGWVGELTVPIYRGREVTSFA